MHHRIVLSASAVLVFGLVIWMLGDDVSRPERLMPPAQAQTVPTAVHAATDPNPAKSVLGTEASVSDDPGRLHLFATSPGQSPREGRAVIGTHASNPQTYGVGSQLASGAVIDEIHTDYVVLVTDSARVRLHRVGIAMPVNEALIVATAVGIADRPVSTEVTSHSGRADFIRPRLVFQGEKVTGFEVRAGRNAHRLGQLDLESGDVIRSIDGRPVAADADWERVTAALGRGGSVVLGIDRKDAAISILVDGARIAEDATAASSALQSTPSM